MEKFEVNILGCGSALPTTKHFPTSQVINLRDKLYMIDCGESAQLQLRRAKINFNRLNHIFLSHIHGDHCFGLPGLISTLSLLGRTSDLHIYGPAELDEPLKMILSTFCYGIEYRVIYHPIDTTQHTLIHEDRSVSVYTLPLKHRIPCCGFLFKEKGTLPHILRDMIDFYQIPTYAINLIKNGADWELADGTIIPNSKLTRPAALARSYAYCSDTIYLPELNKYLSEVDLLFHEATFAEEHRKRAQETYHSTAKEAATLARDSKAKKLCIGHFSARYEDENILLTEAKEIFPNTILAHEGLIIQV